jgi:hypothetical protein
MCVNVNSMNGPLKMKIPKFSRRAILGLVSSFLSASALVGCAVPVPLDGDDKGELRHRAQEYWGLVRANDKLGAWKFELASKDQSLTLEAYLKRGGIVYQALEVRDVRFLGADLAEVDVWMRYDLPLLRIKGQELVVQDQWRRLQGVWYHAPKPSSMLPGAK